MLQAESIDVETEKNGYKFPMAGEVVGLDIANGSVATINIPHELLLARASGIYRPIHIKIFVLYRKIMLSSLQEMVQ